jgi:hypothetical protein
MHQRPKSPITQEIVQPRAASTAREHAPVGRPLVCYIRAMRRSSTIADRPAHTGGRTEARPCARDHTELQDEAPEFPQSSVTATAMPQRRSPDVPDRRVHCLSVGRLSHRGVSPDQFTPVVVSSLLPETERVLGTDGQYHVVYELAFANTSQAPATLKRLEVFDDRDPSAALAGYEGDALVSRLRTLGNTRPETPELDFNETRLVLLHLAFDPGAGVPHRLVHRVEVLAATSPADLTPVPLSYLVAPVQIRPQIPVVGPPLVG